MASDKLPINQTGNDNELSSSLIADASSSAIDVTSTDPDSSLLVTDDGSFPQIPTTANTSVVDEGNASEERRDSTDAEHESVAKIISNIEEDSKSS